MNDILYSNNRNGIKIMKKFFTSVLLLLTTICLSGCSLLFRVIKKNIEANKEPSYSSDSNYYSSDQYSSQFGSSFTEFSSGKESGDVTSISEELSSSEIVSSSETSSEEIKKVTIRFWHTFGQTFLTFMQNKVQTFQQLVKENDGVDVSFEFNYQGSYNDIATKITNGYYVNNRPTIAVSYPDNVADYLEINHDNGEEFVVNLDKFINDPDIGFGKERWLGDTHDETDFVEGFYEEGSYYSADGTYSIPMMKTTEIMFYNKELLNKAMAYFKPELVGQTEKIDKYMKDISWDDFIALSNAIVAHKDQFPNMEVPFCYDSDANFFITQLFQREIPYASIDNNGAGQILFDGDNLAATTSFLEEVYDAYHNGLFTTKGVRSMYGSDFFAREKCVFYICSSGGAGYNFPVTESFGLGICRVPAANDNPVYVSQGPTLALFNSTGLTPEVNSTTLKYAWKFLKYVTNAAVNVDLCVNGSEGYVPVRYSAYETTYFQEFVAEDEYFSEIYKLICCSEPFKYYTLYAFEGSAALREQCGSLLSAVCLTSSKENIPPLIQTAIDNARLKM